MLLRVGGATAHEVGWPSGRLGGSHYRICYASAILLGACAGCVAWYGNGVVAVLIGVGMRALMDYGQMA